MIILNEDSLARALSYCYRVPAINIAIIFASDENYAEFSDAMLNLAAQGKIDGARILQDGAQRNGIYFTRTDSCVYFIRPSITGRVLKTFAFNEILYDPDWEEHGLDEFINGLKIVNQ